MERLALPCKVHVNYRRAIQRDVTSYDVTLNVASWNQTYIVTLPSIVGADWPQGNNVSRVILRHFRYQIFRGTQPYIYL